MSNKIKKVLTAVGLSGALGGAVVGGHINNQKEQDFKVATEDLRGEIIQRYKAREELLKTGAKFTNDGCDIDAFERMISSPLGLIIAKDLYGSGVIYDTLNKDLDSLAKEYGFENFNNLQKTTYEETINDYRNSNKKNKELDEMISEYEANDNITNKNIK